MPQMAAQASAYVSDPAISYRKAVRYANLPIFYARPPGIKVAQGNVDQEVPGLTAAAHTSLFHWVTTFAVRLLPQVGILTADFTPAPRKYTTDRRRSILLACRANCSALLSGPHLST